MVGLRLPVRCSQNEIKIFQTDSNQAQASQSMRVSIAKRVWQRGRRAWRNGNVFTFHLLTHKLSQSFKSRLSSAKTKSRCFLVKARENEIKIECSWTTKHTFSAVENLAMKAKQRLIWCAFLFRWCLILNSWHQDRHWAQWMSFQSRTVAWHKLVTATHVRRQLRHAQSGRCEFWPG